MKTDLLIGAVASVIWGHYYGLKFGLIFMAGWIVADFCKWLYRRWRSA